MADDLALPMDKVDEAPPPQQETEQQQQDRARDEAGRFAKTDAEQQQPQPRGKPDEAAARRREAQERDEARREAADVKAKYDALQKRLDDMASLARGETPEDEKPDPIAKLTEKVEGIGQQLTARQEQERDAAAMQQVRAFADQDEARFTEKTPDFPNAVQHYIGSRIGEMQALGLPDEQIAGVLQQEASTLLIQCAQHNRSPSEAIYAMAKARGYSGGGMMLQQSQARPQANAGGRSFGTGGGAAATGGMTAAQIAALPEEDYMAFRATPEGRRAIARAQGAA